MPDDEKTVVEQNDDAAANADAKASGGKSKLILFGGIGLGAIAIGIVLALFVLKPMMSDSGESTGAEATEEVQAEGGHAAKEPKAPSHGDGHGGSSGTPKGGSLVYAVTDIVVNPAGTGGGRFLSASFAFELTSPSLEKEFVAQDAKVRDALITILTSKTVAQLTDPKQKEITRYQIKKRLATVMDTDAIENVYFTDFVLQ
ncbi:MAG: flagellar basal body-associated FliL family protein [bacterium]